MFFQWQPLFLKEGLGTLALQREGLSGVRGRDLQKTVLAGVGLPRATERIHSVARIGLEGMKILSAEVGIEAGLSVVAVAVGLLVEDAVVVAIGTADTVVCDRDVDDRDKGSRSRREDDEEYE